VSPVVVEKRIKKMKVEDPLKPKYKKAKFKLTLPGAASGYVFVQALPTPETLGDAFTLDNASQYFFTSGPL
jgi:hypothetical protein